MTGRFAVLTGTNSRNAFLLNVGIIIVGTMRFIGSSNSAHIYNNCFYAANEFIYGLFLNIRLRVVNMQKWAAYFYGGVHGLPCLSESFFNNIYVFLRMKIP